METGNTMHTTTASGFGITSFTLKIIAVISMFIDHLGATVVLGCLYSARYVTVAMRESDRLLDQVLVWVNQNWSLSVSIYEHMRLIGRIAFPIYCFLIAKGFFYTRDVKKYALRLGIFALISEIPFDLAFNEGWLDLSSNNVYFTLLIGLLVIWGISWVREKCELNVFALSAEKQEVTEEQKESAPIGLEVLRTVGGLLAILALIGAGAFLAKYILHTDYGASGVLTIVAMYLLYKNPWFGYIVGVLVLTYMTHNSTELIALLGAIPVWYYSGRKGKNIRYFFYVFYPAHLLVLWFITYLLGFK